MISKLVIELEKLPDGGSLLRCSREDGSAVWQRNRAPRGAFFAMHDLRHYAVESVLKTSRGFFGLIAAGWEILDTTGKGARGELSPETLAIEHLVGLLDAESTSDGPLAADAVNAYAAEHARQGGRDVPKEIAAGQLDRMRKLAANLHAAWRDLPAGQTMRLDFRTLPNEPRLA